MVGHALVKLPARELERLRQAIAAAGLGVPTE